MSKRKRDLAQAEPQPSATPYEPTERERAALDVYRDRRRARPERVDIKVVEASKGAVTLSPDHPDIRTGTALLCDSIGSGSKAFTHSLVEGLAQATAKGGLPQQTGINNALAMVQALQPQDEAEAMLAAQMAMVHQAVMHSARRLQHCDTLQQLEAHDRCLNRLTRTYAAQMDALKRYRSGGQQRMTVEHVHVHEGGQAIVGTVNHGPGGGGATSKPEPTP
jgi:hypothetical protein